MAGPSRLSRYVLSELVSATTLGISVWTVIVLLNDLFLIAREAIQKDLSLETVLTLLALRVPQILTLSIPIGTLFGSLIGVGRLASDHELVAIQALGVGPKRLAGIMAVHGGVIALAGLALFAFFNPWSAHESRQIRGQFMNVRSISSELRPRVFYDSLPGYLLFVDEIPAGSQGRLQRVLVYQVDRKEKDAEQLIVAKGATLEPAPGGPGRIRIVFKDGVQNLFRVADPASYRSTQFQTFWSPPIVPPQWMLPVTGPIDKTTSDMYPRELARELKDADAETDRTMRPFRQRNVRAEIHFRAALPLASFFFALLALPLGMGGVRSGKGAGFAVSFIVVLLYWLVFIVGSQQARDGRIPLALGFWAANGCVAVWAVVAYARLGKGTQGRLMSWVRARIESFRRRRAKTADPTSTGDRRTTPPLPGRVGGMGAILDRYLGALYLRMLALALAATYLVYSLVELKGIVDAIAERHQSLALVGTYFKFFLPGVLVFTLPFAAMIAAVVAVTLLARSGEITALKAAGWSARRICVPILVTTLVTCGALFLVQDQIAPETNRRAQAIKDRIQGRNPRSYGVLSGGRWVFGSQGRLYHYRTFDPQQLSFQGLSVFRVDLGAARILDQSFCASAQWEDGAWHAERGWTRHFPESGAAGDYRTFESTRLEDLDPPGNFSRTEQTRLAGNELAEQVSIEELWTQIGELARAGYDTTRFRVQFWQKTATAVTPFVTVLLGLPFAFKVGRRGSMYGVGVGLVLAIVFYAVAAIFNALGLETMLPPFLAAWSPNLIFGTLGVILFLYIPT